MDVFSWLRDLGLERYEQAFRDNEVDARSLPHLTTEDLKELGVTAIGHRRVLLQEIAKMQGPDGAPAADSAQDSCEDAGQADQPISEAERR